MNTIKEIWTSLSERFQNPLLYSFALSWIVINYKIPIVLLSSATHTEKIGFIEAYVHPQNGDNLASLAYTPSISAIAYVFLLPLVSLLSTYTTSVYERWHQNIRTGQSRKAILTKEQREKLEHEVADLNNRLRRQTHEAEAKLQEATVEMQRYTSQLNGLVSPIWFIHLKTIASSWLGDSIKPPPGREIKGAQEQQDFVKASGIPKSWAKVFEIIRRPEGVRPSEVAGPLNLSDIEALEVLISLCALNMLVPTWHNGALHFNVAESSWVALLNGRPA